LEQHAGKNIHIAILKSEGSYKEMLDGMRVLDLADERGYLCGRLLADMGADVIKIEKPCGDHGRRLGPFYHDQADPEKSLYWFAYNLNKRGITLDIETADGKAIFLKLVATADALVESFAPGYLDGLGLGYPVLSKINPRIILTSISPFGQNGPYSNFKGSDIVLMAMGGYMYTCGDPDRPPLRVGFPQADLFGGAEGAAGTMVAYYHQQITGEGQQVDVSTQDAVTWTSGGHGFWALNGIILGRAGSYRAGLSSMARQRQLWKCKDGDVTFQIYGGKFGAKSNRALIKWMDSKGYASDFQKSMDWDNFDMSQLTQDIMDKIEQPIATFFLAHSKNELEEESIKRDIMFYPVSDMEDAYNSVQLKARNFWTGVEHPELGSTITYPGAWSLSTDYKMHFKKAPLIGEHNTEIYKGELGFSDNDLIMLKQAGVI
jgi:benzylsuccinate CoA-transferase BbsE subunit